MPLITSRYDASGNITRLEELASLSLAERPWRRRRRSEDRSVVKHERDSDASMWQRRASDAPSESPKHRMLAMSPKSLSSPLAAFAGKVLLQRYGSEEGGEKNASPPPHLANTAGEPLLCEASEGVENVEESLPAGSKEQSCADAEQAFSEPKLLDGSSCASSDTGIDPSVDSSKTMSGIPNVLAEVFQQQGTWNPDLWLRARNELLQSRDVRHMNELWQSVFKNTEQVVSQQAYKVGSQSYKLCSTPRLATSLTWFGQENAGTSPVTPESFSGSDKEQLASEVSPPVLVCAASPLDILVHLRTFLSEDQPIILVADVVDFDKSGNADLAHPSTVRPQCLPLRTDFRRYATEAAACLKGGKATMQSHLCARYDPYVFLCPNVSVFRGSREAGYPLLPTPIQAHVITTAQVEARPSVQTLLGNSGKTEWYSDEKAHAALLDRLNLISLVALNKVDHGRKTEDLEHVDKRPILILGTFGCGGGRSGRHPHHAIANALKHWRRHFSCSFHSIFVCCERDGGHGDPTRAALLDRIINRQVYRTLDVPGLAAKLAQWHWDKRQLQLCIRPSKLLKVYELCNFLKNSMPFGVGLQSPQHVDSEECDRATANADTSAGKVEPLQHVQDHSINSSSSPWTPLDSRASIRRASTLVMLGGSSVQCSVYGESPFPCREIPDESSDDGFDSTSSESDGKGPGWFTKSLVSSARSSRTSLASAPHSSRRGSSCRGSTVQQSRQASKDSSAVPLDCEPRRLSLSLFGWKSSNSRRASMLSRRSSALSSRRASGRNLDSQRPSVVNPEEGHNESLLAVPGASLGKPDSCNNSARSSLAIHDDNLAFGQTSFFQLECPSSSPYISLAIPEHTQLHSSAITDSSSSRSQSRRNSVSKSPHALRRASASGAGGGGRRISCGQRLGPLARRLSVNGDIGRRASVSHSTNRRSSIGGDLSEYRRFSIGGELSCLPEQDCEKPRGSGGSRSSSFSSSHHSDAESDTPLEDVHKNRIAGELAERVEDIELLRRESFESLTKQLHKEKTRMMRRRSTLADLIGSSCMTSLVVAHDSESAQNGPAARESPSKEPSSKPNNKHNVHMSREEINIRQQVRERLRNRRQKMCCRRGAGSLAFAQHNLPGLHDGGEDCLDERPATSLTGAEQLQSGRRLSTFATICGSRNFVLGRM